MTKTTYKRTKEYKTEAPYRTINKIRNILYDLDIFVEELHDNHSLTGTASCRVFIAEDKITNLDIGTNGKGMNARYSLASGYAEFMERLQNSFLLPRDIAEAAFRRGELPSCYAPDEKMMTVDEIIEECGDYLGDILETSRDKAIETIRLMYCDEKVSCVPFKNMVTGKTVYFPFSVISQSQGSNGMCAGNTEDEALVQGFSEVFERYALAQIYIYGAAVRKIRPDAFAGTDIYQRLENLKARGYEYEILDFSIGKGLPVLGLKIRIAGSGVMAIWMGADPNPETALERCLTEMFQGSSNWLRKKFTNLSVEDLSDEPDRYITAHEELLNCTQFLWPERIMKGEPDFCETFPCSGFATEKADNEYMQKIALSLSKNLFVRYTGYLGFPSYWILVPGISAANYKPEELLEQLKGWHERKVKAVTEAPDKPEYKGIVRILNNMYNYKR